MTINKIEILCTLGPSSLDGQVIKRLDGLGVGLFKINLSHTKSQNLSFIIDTIQAHTNNANNNGAVEVLNLKNEALLYPNPTQSIVTIEHPSIEQIAVYDVMGKLMHLEKSNRKSTINCQHWPAGMYIVKVGTQAHRLIIQ